MPDEPMTTAAGSRLREAVDSLADGRIDLTEFLRLLDDHARTPAPAVTEWVPALPRRTRLALQKIEAL